MQQLSRSCNHDYVYVCKIVISYICFLYKNTHVIDITFVTDVNILPQQRYVETVNVCNSISCTC